jgi:group I intron endonuclease
MFRNRINGNKYIGSAMNLYNRLSFYFSFSAMENSLKNSQSYIYNALLKHGHSNFSLTILEYCKPEKCLEREDYYQKTLKPEYNIAKKPGAPMSGRKHSDNSKQIMSDAKKGENNPNFGKTINHSNETKQIMSDVKKKEKNPMFGQNHTEETKTKMSDAKKGKPRPEGSGKASQVIEVTDITNNTTIFYDSICEAARALNCNESSIRSNIKSNSNKPYKGRYTLKKLN